MNSEYPLVSIICPAHNRVGWLIEAIQSVLAQTYREFELIVIDDASDPPIDSQLGNIDPRINILRQNRNIGPGASREIGRLVAQGKYINYLDSDDYLDPEKIARQVELMEDEPTIGMCYCISLVFNKLPLSKNEPVCSLSNRSFDSILPIILYQRPWSTSSCLWRKEAVDKIGPWTSLWVGEDIEYETRAGCRGIKVGHLPEILSFYRQNDNEAQLSNQSPQRLIEATDYLLLNANNILHSPYKSTNSVSSRIVQVLLNHAIFLFTQGNKVKAQKCLKALVPFLQNNNKVNTINILTFLAGILPAKTNVTIGRLIRPIIFNGLTEENEYSKYLQQNRFQ